MLGDYVKKQENQPILLDIPAQISLPANKQVSQEYRTQESIKDILSDKNISDKVEVSEEVREEKKIISEDKKNEPDPNRKAVIISALEVKGHSSISDIARLFNGTIGEKTVQRELNALVEVGAIKKEGEKRWRRYFL